MALRRPSLRHRRPGPGWPPRRPVTWTRRAPATLLQGPRATPAGRDPRSGPLARAAACASVSSRIPKGTSGGNVESCAYPSRTSRYLRGHSCRRCRRSRRRGAAVERSCPTPRLEMRPLPSTMPAFAAVIGQPDQLGGVRLGESCDEVAGTWPSIDADRVAVGDLAMTANSGSPRCERGFGPAAGRSPPRPSTSGERPLCGEARRGRARARSAPCSRWH